MRAEVLKPKKKSIWDRLRKTDKGRADVVVVFRLFATQDGWDCDYASRDFMQDGEKYTMPDGVPGAIVESLAGTIVGKHGGKMFGSAAKNMIQTILGKG